MIHLSLSVLYSWGEQCVGVISSTCKETRSCLDQILDLWNRHRHNCSGRCNLFYHDCT